MEIDDTPVNVGDIVKVKIEGIGEKGDGIAKVQRYVLIIPDTKEGEEYEVKVTKCLRKFGFAEKVEKDPEDTKGFTTKTEPKEATAEEKDPDTETREPYTGTKIEPTEETDTKKDD